MSFEISYVIFGNSGLRNIADVAKAIFSRLNVEMISQLRWCRSRPESPGDPEWIPSDSDVSVDLFLNSIVQDIKTDIYYMIELYESKIEAEINAQFINNTGKGAMGEFQMEYFGITIGEHYATTSSYDDPAKYQKCSLSFRFTGSQWPEDWNAFEKECQSPIRNETLLGLFKEIRFEYQTGCSTC